MRLPQKGETWRHFKGNEYGIDSIREDEDGNIVVCYGGRWTRKLTDFMARVEDTQRFVRIADEPPTVGRYSSSVRRKLKDLAAGLGVVDSAEAVNRAIVIDALRAGQSLDDLGEPELNLLANNVVEYLGKRV